MNNTVIEVIRDKVLWDKFVEESPNGLLFHKWDFLKIIEKHSGFDLYTYGIYKGNELFAIAPLFFKNKMGVKLAYSPPQGTLVYIPYMGIVTSRDYAGFKQRKKESYLDLACVDLHNELTKRSTNFSSFTFVPQMNDIRPFLWDGYQVHLLYTYFIDLVQPIDTIWEGLEKVCRKNIKHAAQNNLSIRQSTDADLFMNIMAENLKDQGQTFFQRQGSGYIKDLLSAYPQNIKMYFLYMDEEIAGVRINCEYKDLCMAWLGDTALQREIPSNEFFIWEMIKMAKSADFKRYENWGGDMRRLNQFKTKFNPHLVPYYNIRKSDMIGKLSDYGYSVISNPHLKVIKNIMTRS